MKIERRGRYWAVYASDGGLICLAVYKKGAQEVLRRLENVQIDEVALREPRKRRYENRKGL